jgi:hypothetical protein
VLPSSGFGHRTVVLAVGPFGFVATLRPGQDIRRPSSTAPGPEFSPGSPKGSNSRRGVADRARLPADQVGATCGKCGKEPS